MLACSHVVVTYFRFEWYMLGRYTYLLVGLVLLFFVHTTDDRITMMTDDEK